jgi:hypothetical protein
VNQVFLNESKNLINSSSGLARHTPVNINSINQRRNYMIGFKEWIQLGKPSVIKKTKENQLKESTLVKMLREQLRQQLSNRMNTHDESIRTAEEVQPKDSTIAIRTTLNKLREQQRKFLSDRLNTHQTN